MKRGLRRSNAKKPDAIDRHVGSRVRAQRMLRGLTQEKIAEAIGVTFQQVQKYEKGTNRIGAGRLNRIAEILGVPISLFYEDAPQQKSPTRVDDSKLSKVSGFLATRQGIALMNSFLEIEDESVRRRLVSLMSAISHTKGQGQKQSGSARAGA